MPGRRRGIARVPKEGDMIRFKGSAALSVAGALVFLASCTREPAASKASATRPSTAPTPAVSATAGLAIGFPIDVSSLSGRITFSSGTDDVWVVNANGSGLKRLTTNQHDDFDPAWSPDGRRIAFRSMRDGNNEVYVMNADGSRQHDVSDDPADDWGPAWTSNGKVLWNCARDLGFGFHGCTANPDGSGLHVIPNDVYVEYPSGSPDGTRIAFMSQQPGAHGKDPNYDIFVMNVDGSGLRQLTDAPGEDGFPSWSPDGRKIAYSTTRDDCSNSTSPDCRVTGDIGPYQTIYVMNADGSEQHRLSLQLGQFVDWSPDGQYLVFSPGLEVIRSDGTGLASIPITGTGSDAQFADWGR
jgi:Tol biopolymer transport system component